jgi:putative glutamine amidotransferase
MGKRPSIGVFLDYEAEGSFSQRPHYAIRTSYFDAIWKAGGIPVGIPYIDSAMPEFMELCDGFLFPGGFYPFPARLYEEPQIEHEVLHPRFKFEEQFMSHLIDSNFPVLGVCAGMQVMAGLYGGKFYRNLHDVIETDINHLNYRPAEQVAHNVDVVRGSHLHSILGVTQIAVNTAHNEALSNSPDSLIINATAEDGVVEGIEIPGKQFCLGVQWHPEFFANDGDTNFNLFTALVDAASESAK